MVLGGTDIQYRYSGGGSNSDSTLSLGGAISSAQIPDDTLMNFFDTVSGTESSAGDVEYRCIYIHNSHATLTLLSGRIFLPPAPAGTDPTPSSTVAHAIGLATEGIGGTPTAIANEGTAPSGVTFSSPSTRSAGLELGDIAPGQSYPVWLRRTVQASTAALENNRFWLEVAGDSAAE